MSEWKESNATFRKFVQEGDEIDYEMYHYFSGIISPIWKSVNSFLMGSPIILDSDMQIFYMYFYTYENRYYYGGLRKLTQNNS